MEIIQGDNLPLLKLMEDNSVDSVVTDPPYGLSFMGKKWDYDVPSKELWQEVLRVLKPGGHLLSFSGTRTYHRMAVAIEDAGFEVRDMIEWVYGSGFPKSLNIGKAVDKLQGNEREEFENKNGSATGSIVTTGTGNLKRVFMDSKGTSEWEGWGTALKPAHEPICMARKPLAEKTVAENVLKYGTGGINIDESRVGMSQEDKEMLDAKASINNNGVNFDVGEGKAKGTATPANNLGRFPANLIHDNSEEVRECFPETGKAVASKRGADRNGDVYGTYNLCDTVRGHDDNGGNASRFFKSIIYQAKASKSERNKGCEGLDNKLGGSLEGGNDKRNGKDKPQLKETKNNHPTVKPVALMEYLIEMVTPKGGTVLDPYMGSGTTGIACKQKGFDFIGIEMDDTYLNIAKERISNTHPTSEVE